MHAICIEYILRYRGNQLKISYSIPSPSSKLQYIEVYHFLMDSFKNLLPANRHTDWLQRIHIVNITM